MSSHPLDAWALDPDVRHLNHGSFGAVPRVTLDELRALRTEMETNPCRWFRGLPERVARARTDIARYLRVAPDTLALVPNASAGISTVLSSLELPPGSEVLLTDHSYGAVTMGVTRAAERAGARVRTLHIPLDATPAQIAALFADALGDTGAPTSSWSSTRSPRPPPASSLSPTSSRTPTRQEPSCSSTGRTRRACSPTPSPTRARPTSGWATCTSGPARPAARPPSCRAATGRSACTR